MINKIYALYNYSEYSKKFEPRFEAYTIGKIGDFIDMLKLYGSVEFRSELTASGYSGDKISELQYLASKLEGYLLSTQTDSGGKEMTIQYKFIEYKVNDSFTTNSAKAYRNRVKRA